VNETGLGDKMTVPSEQFTPDSNLYVFDDQYKPFIFGKSKHLPNTYFVDYALTFLVLGFVMGLGALLITNPDVIITPLPIPLIQGLGILLIIASILFAIWYVTTTYLYSTHAQLIVGYVHGVEKKSYMLRGGRMGTNHIFDCRFQSPAGVELRAKASVQVLESKGLWSLFAPVPDHEKWPVPAIGNQVAVLYVNRWLYKVL
jgi:multisubunit Na+/H+ antiporter MnhF subunit